MAMPAASLCVAVNPAELAAHGGSASQERAQHDCYFDKETDALLRAGTARGSDDDAPEPAWERVGGRSPKGHVRWAGFLRHDDDDCRQHELGAPCAQNVGRLAVLCVLAVIGCALVLATQPAGLGATIRPPGYAPASDDGVANYARVANDFGNLAITVVQSIAADVDLRQIRGNQGNRCLAGPRAPSPDVAAEPCNFGVSAQLWRYDKVSHLVRDMSQNCLELVTPAFDGSVVRMGQCNGANPQQLWEWNGTSGQFRVAHDSSFCLVIEGSPPPMAAAQILVRKCPSDGSQSWNLGEPIPLPSSPPLPKVPSRSRAHCVNGRFNPPRAPEQATGRNGVELQDVCFAWAGANKSAHVFVIGDWGGLNLHGGPKPADHRARRFGGKWRPFLGGVDDSAQQRVAHQMAIKAPQAKPDYVLNVGDNFYWAGISDTTGKLTCSQKPTGFAQGPVSPQWSEVWDAVYKGPYLQGLQWLGVLGNHDYGGFRFDSDWHQTIGYTWISNGRWMTPAQYWKVKVWYPDFSVDYYFVDTNVVDARAPDTDASHNICSRSHNPPDAHCPSTGPANVELCSSWFNFLWQQEVEWLDMHLALSGADWQIIVTHFPPTSSLEYWQDLSRKHGIDIIFAGHIHWQIVDYDPKGPFGGTAVVISGGGGGITSEAGPSADGSDNQYGFVDMTLTRSEIVVELISHGGQVRSTTSISPREPQ